MNIGRRSFVLGAGALIAAPMIVPYGRLMRVKRIDETHPWTWQNPPWRICMWNVETGEWKTHDLSPGGVVYLQEGTIGRHLRGPAEA